MERITHNGERAKYNILLMIEDWGKTQSFLIGIIFFVMPTREASLILATAKGCLSGRHDKKAILIRQSTIDNRQSHVDN